MLAAGLDPDATTGPIEEEFAAMGLDLPFDDEQEEKGEGGGGDSIC